MSEMSIPVEALGYQMYGGRCYFLGDTIQVENEGDVADLEAMRLAKRIKKAPAAEESRGMTPEEDPPALPPKGKSKGAVVPPLKRGKYVTRTPQQNQR